MLTDFGDSAAMLPAAALLFVWLIGDGRIRAAGLWVALLVGQAGLVAATKIAFRGWGIGIQALDFTGISGHSMLACSVIPIALLVVTRGAALPVRVGALVLGAAMGVAIGVSRVALSMHSWSEVVAGCALGCLVTVLFAALADIARGATRLPAPTIAAVLVALVMLMHGTHAPSEHLITRVALHLSGHRVPYTRDDLHDPWRRAMWDEGAAISPKTRSQTPAPMLGMPFLTSQGQPT